jgi:hypothetical protein
MDLVAKRLEMLWRSLRREKRKRTIGGRQLT